MAFSPDMLGTEQIVGLLTRQLGKLCREVTGRNIVLAEEVIPKPDGEYILLDLSAMDQVDWESGEVIDENGVRHGTHNYLLTYTLTAYRGKSSIALSRICQSFGLPYLYYKYFPENSPFAYSSCSTISKMRVPLNLQMYEDRARVQINFNVVTVEQDFGTFEDLERVGISIGVNTPGDREEIPATVDKNWEENEPPNPDILPPEYHDKIVDVVTEKISY